MRRPAAYSLSMHARGRCAGNSSPFREIQQIPLIRPGWTGARSAPVPPTSGRRWMPMKGVGSFTRPWVPPRRISSAACAPGLICIRVPWWPSMPTLKSPLALSKRAPRHLELRRVGAAAARRSQARWGDDSGRRSEYEAGFVFVFDRTTGKPLFPIEERPVPQGG